MRKFSFSAACVAVALAMFLAPAALPKGQKRIEAYKAQTTMAFANEEEAPAAGLKVALSNAGEVKLDPDTGRAGPFRDVKGNGTGSITLTNPEAPVEPGSEVFELVFGTYSKKIAVKSWWWIDANGKRIGEKKKV